MKLQLSSDSFARASEKANRLQPEIRFRAGKMRDCVRLRVLGSGRVWYRMWLYESKEYHIGAKCECAAGDKGLHCYHVAAAWERYLLLAANGCIPDILEN